jgi:PAS domain S-box-containing protein
MQAVPPLLWLRRLKSMIDFSALTVASDTSLSEAIALMTKGGKNVLVKSASQVIGWLTDRDVIRLVAAGVDLETTKISEVIYTSDISLKLSELADIQAVLSLLQQQQSGLLPVVDEQGQFIGTITSESICQALTLDPALTNQITGHDGEVLCIEGLTPTAKHEFSKIYCLTDFTEDIPEHRQTLEALRESEERFRFLAELLPQQVWITQANGSIEYVNQRVLDYFACTKEQIVEGWQQLAHPDDLPECLDIWQTSLATGEPLEIEGRWLRVSDNTYHWHLVRALPWHDQQGKIIKWFGTNTDIHDRVSAEESLLRFHKAIENTSDAVAITNTEGQCIYLNPAFVEIYGYTLEELQAAEGATVIFQQPQECEQILLTVMSGQSWRSETTMRKRSRSGRQTSSSDDILHVDLRSDAIKDVTGKIIGKVCIHTDITQRKQAESGLWLRDRAIAASSNGIIISDVTLPNAPIIYVNPAFERMTGYSAAEVIGQNYCFLQHADINQPQLKQLRTAMQTGQNCTVMLRNYREDGSLFWNQLNISPVYDVDRELTHYIGIQSDITERKQLEEELRLTLEKEKELSELKSRFITMISHEFRTPLSTILSSSELLEHYRHKWTQEKQLTHLHRIQTSVKRMTEILSDILFIGKAEAGILEYRPTSLDLVEYCCHLVEDLKLDLNHQHLISFTSQFTSIPCNMDEKLLGYILSNLLSNAIKYSPSHSTIQFTLSCQQERAVFAIQDQGIGIPPEDIPHLFESFHRAQNVGNILGTGLGLTIVKNCVDIHQGEISVTSQLGVGTTFTLTLPLNRNREEGITNDKQG